MNRFYQRAAGRLIVLLLTFSVILSSLFGCNLFRYVADTKDEIGQNIEYAESNSLNNYVFQYLIDWGMPHFDNAKFAYFEVVFEQHYNYTEEMPNTLSHAQDTGTLFLERYFDSIDINDKSEVTDALLFCYVYSFDDPYAIYRSPVETDSYQEDMSGKFGGIGVMVEYNTQNETIMISTVYENSPAEAAGIKNGDIIYAVDGVTVAELGYTNAVNYVRGEIGTPVELTLIRNDSFVTVTAIRGLVEEINVSSEIIGNIGYVRIVAFKTNTIDQFINEINKLEDAGVEGIIFDLRGNPGGYVQSVLDVMSYILPSSLTVMSYEYKNGSKYVLKTSDDGEEDHTIDLPMTVICNEYTASAGEIFTACIRDYRNSGLLKASIVGSVTFGKGVMQSSFSYLPDSSSVTFTVAYYNPPSNENYHDIGIIPDVELENTDSEDLQLEEAIKQLQILINAN